MKIEIYQVDSFTETFFGGNASAVCTLPHWIDDALMQNIAFEINLNKTAFLVPHSDTSYDVRWFTPENEITLCDHTALASAYVIFNELNYPHDVLTLNSIGGEIVISKENTLFSMTFTSYMPTLYKENNPLFSLAMGIEPLKVLHNKDFIFVYENEEMIKKLNPKTELLKSLDLRGVCITARGDESDFVFRYFAPKLGNTENLITGSVCSQLVPYWTQVLQKNDLTAHQLTANRTGKLFCSSIDHQVVIKGNAKLFMKGAISLDSQDYLSTLSTIHSKNKFAIAI